LPVANLLLWTTWLLPVAVAVDNAKAVAAVLAVTLVRLRANLRVVLRLP
jgi:hypothetical protein